MSGLFTSVGGTIENGMSIYVNSVSSAISSAIVPVVTTAVTIWIVAYGFAVMRGEAHESVPAYLLTGRTSDPATLALDHDEERLLAGYREPKPREKRGVLALVAAMTGAPDVEADAGEAAASQGDAI